MEDVVEIGTQDDAGRARVMTVIQQMMGEWRRARAKDAASDRSSALEEARVLIDRLELLRTAVVAPFDREIAEIDAYLAWNLSASAVKRMTIEHCALELRKHSRRTAGQLMTSVGASGIPFTRMHPQRALSRLLATDHRFCLEHDDHWTLAHGS